MLKHYARKFANLKNRIIGKVLTKCLKCECEFEKKYHFNRLCPKCKRSNAEIDFHKHKIITGGGTREQDNC